MMIPTDQSVAIARYTAGGFVALASPLLTDHTVADVMVAILGGFVAMAPAETVARRTWELVIGIALGIGVAIIMRSGGFNDFIVRLMTFLSAVLSTKLVDWIQNPTEGAKALSAMRQLLVTLLGGGK